MELMAVEKADTHRRQGHSHVWFQDHQLPVEMGTLEALHTCHHKAGWPFSDQIVSSRCALSPPPPASGVHQHLWACSVLCWELLLVSVDYDSLRAGLGFPFIINYPSSWSSAQ